MSDFSCTCLIGPQPFSPNPRGTHVSPDHMLRCVTLNIWVLFNEIYYGVPIDKNTNSWPLIQPYSYTTPHNIHSSAIYNQYTPSPSSITPQLACSKTQTGCISHCPCTCVAMPRDFPTPAGRQAHAVNKRVKESSSDESNKENGELSTSSTSQPKNKKCTYTRHRTVDKKAVQSLQCY